MNRKKKVIIILLMIAILFSALSIVINISITKMPELNEVKTEKPSASRGNVGLIVEKSKYIGGFE